MCKSSKNKLPKAVIRPNSIAVKASPVESTDDEYLFRDYGESRVIPQQFSQTNLQQLAWGCAIICGLCASGAVTFNVIVQAEPSLSAPLPGSRPSNENRTTPLIPAKTTGGSLDSGSVNTISAGPGNADGPEHPLLAAIRFAQTGLKALDDVKDYTSTFEKIEMVNGQLVRQTIFVKFREKPFSVYLKYPAPNAGREILYVHGFNQNLLFAHEGSGLKALVGTVTLASNDPRIMAETRRPITDMGMRNLCRMVIDQWQLESKYGECDVQYFPEAKVDNTKCQVIESSHPRPRRQFQFHKTRLFLDEATKLPFRVENYGFPQKPGDEPPILEQYTFLKISTNVGLQDADFDRLNPNYGF